MHKPAMLLAAARLSSMNRASLRALGAALRAWLASPVPPVGAEGFSRGTPAARRFRLRLSVFLLMGLALLSGAAPAFADSFYFTRMRSQTGADPIDGPTGLFLWNDATGAQSQVGGNGTYLRHATDGTIPVDGIATNGGTLYGFAIDDASTAGFTPLSTACVTSMRSRLVSINTTTGVFTYVGPWLSGRDIRAAGFDGQGRLWVADCVTGQILQINPATGLVAGTIASGMPGSNFAHADIDFAANGTGIIGISTLQFVVFNPGEGWVANTAINALSNGFDSALSPPYIVSGVGFTNHLSARNGSPAAATCRLNIVEARGRDELGHVNDPFFASPPVAYKEVDQFDPPNQLAQHYNGGTEDMARVGGPALPSCFFDFGDASASYGTLKANNGAFHAIVAGSPYLGSGMPDFEVDGQPNATAAGDNASGINDEDGVAIPVLSPGGEAQITVSAGNVSAGTRLQAWIDWAGDGSFAEAGDQILVDATVVAGINTFTVNVPAGAVSGFTYARFRIANESGLGAIGPAASGEIEDYRIEIQALPTVAKALVGESITDNDIAEPGETLTYEVTVIHAGGPAFSDFDFIENIPDGATMVSVTGADGFTGPVAGPATVQLTVPTVPVGGTAVVTVELLVDAPIPLGVTDITNRISGGDVPEDCADCSVTIPTPTYVPVRPPTISCTTTANYFNTAYNASTGGMLTSGTEPYWEVALTQTPVTGAPPASLAWGNATVVSNPPGVYMTSPFSNANWISHNATATHPAAGNYDIFYRYQFNLAPGVDPASLDLDMTLYSDNAVYQVWVNGVAQGIRSNYGSSDPYFYVGFNAAGGASGSMNGAWQSGLNTMIVHIKSGPGAQAFMAQVETPALCRPKLTLRKSVLNDDGGTATATDFTLRATGQAPLINMIEGPMGDAAVTNASVPAGRYTLAEDNLTGYVASAYSCSIDGGSAAPITNNELVLANGQNAICTITNDDRSPAMTLEKTGILNDADGDGLIDLGETISYSFRVENTGGTTLTGVTVDDPLLDAAGITVTPGPQTLAPGGTATFTATYTPTQAEIDAGQVTNTATGTGTPPSGPPITTPPDTVTVPPEQTPALSIDKTGTLNDSDGDGLLDPGETISYSFLVRNTGSVTMTNVTVNDPLLVAAGVPVTPGPQTLGPGGTATFTATYTPTQAEIDAGQVSNTATGTGTPPSGPPIDSPPDTVIVPPDQVPGLVIEKTGTLNDLDGDGLIDLGETISYSFLVRNTGAVTLTGVTVNDPLVTVVEGPQTLAPGATFTFTATYTPTQADIDAGQVTNTATGTGTPPSGPPIDSPPDTVVVPPDDAPQLAIEKTGTLNDLDGDGLIDLGETISYSFLVRNTGAVTLTGVTVEDQLLDNAGITVTPGPQTLAPGGTATFTATYTPTQAEIDAGQVSNTATGTGTPPSGPPIDSPPDTVVVPPDQTPGLSIVKTGTLNDLDGDGLIDLGETISYSFRVTNTGSVTMTNVTVNDPLLVNAGISVTPGPQTLGPRGSATFTATYTPTQADIDAGRVANTATGTGTPPSGPPIESPPDTVVVPPDQTPGLTIDKTGTLNDADGDGLLDAGETITYTFVVTNTGAVTMTNVTVNDPLLSNAGISVTPGPQTLAPGADVTFTATYAPRQAEIDAGRVVNTAAGTGTPPSGPPVESPPDTVVVPPDQTPGLTIEKTGTLNDLDGDGLLDPGETISYAFLATNTGAVTLTDVTIDDPLLTNAGIAVTPAPQTLAPGANVTFTAVYTPTQADIDAGAVENIATGTGTPPSGPPIESPPDSVTVPPQPASLELVKTGRFDDLDGNGAASVGDTLIYTFTVTNDGGQTAADVWPKDPGPTFNGQPATGTLSTFTPGPVSLSPGQQAVFTATYTLTEADVANAAGAPDSVANTATAIGYINGNVITGTPVESEESQSVITLPAAVSDISIAKVALLRHIRRGEEAPFAITVTNNAASAAQGLTVIDTLPSGFRYVEGSGSVNGVAVTPVVEGRRVIFENVSVPANSKIEIRLRMLALSSAGPGEHVNRASVTDASGNPLAPDATATIEILVEPVFDCGDIIGKVFDDRNRNGYQDEGEPGLPGVRIATVDGWLITTDAHGRFHVPCAALPDQRIGSNFIMKLDTRTLPTGYRVTTENPRVVRLTAGKMTELNFGASIGRVVRLDLQDAAFLPGELELRPEWALGIDQLIAVLAQEQSVLRLTYIDAAADPQFAEERLKHLADLVGERWRQTSGQYRLEIEMRVETGQ